MLMIEEYTNKINEKRSELNIDPKKENKGEDNKTRILVVDDEETLCDVLKFNLELEGYDVDVAYSAEEALKLHLPDYSLILLDIMMGEISGVQMATMMKKNPDTANIPIIFCTAKTSDEEMVEGLDLGADDYVTKPYSLKNVSARVKAVLRRSTTSRKNVSEEETNVLTFKGISIYPLQKLCKIDDQEVKMPRKELEMLYLMMQHPNRIFTRAELLTNIWPENVLVVDRVVDVNITRLRNKLGSYGKHIVTRPGYGYGFAE